MIKKQNSKTPIQIDKTIHKSLKLYAAENNTPMTEIAEKAIVKQIKKKISGKL